MRLGCSLPQVGRFANADAVVRVAQQAEALGYDSVWVLDRVLWPLNPRAPYPASADGSLPDAFKTVLDPLETLTYAAAYTTRVRLGTSVLNIPYYNPVLLARSLTTLDVLSGGRLQVGFGMGWSPDEYEAVGSAADARNARADEFLQVLKAIWTTDPVSFGGTYYRVAPSVVQPKPVQKPYPPIYMAAYGPKAMQRVATQANGWNPAGVPLEGMRQMMAGMRQMAKAAGRDPASLELVVRANLYTVDGMSGPERPIFVGTVEQIRADLDGCRELGATEIILEQFFDPDVHTLDDAVGKMERLRELVGG